jgi:hypothetical protein
MGEGPIHVTGNSYSGKTQLRLMLSAHPNILITRRTYMWRRYAGKFGDLGGGKNLERCMRALLESEHIRDLIPDPERVRRAFRAGEPSYWRLFALIREAHARDMGKARWGDQHRLVQYDADALLRLDSRTVILHMIRDPIDRTAESLAGRRKRRLKVGWETSLWRRSAQLALRNQRRYPENYRVVRCERLFSDPRDTLRGICDFLSEAFSERMLRVEGLSEMGVAVPQAPPNHADMGQSRNGGHPGNLTPPERAYVRSRTGKEMVEAGYEATDVQLSAGDRLGYVFVDFPTNLAAELLERVWRAAKSN